MAVIVPIFEEVLSGTRTLTSELWVDLGLIPTGQQHWFGYATYIAETKYFTFELRTNKTGKSAATVADTTLHDFGAANQDSVDRDFFQFGNVLASSVVGTGVERSWLRIRSNTGASGDASYIIYMTSY